MRILPAVFTAVLCLAPGVVAQTLQHVHRAGALQAQMSAFFPEGGEPVKCGFPTLQGSLSQREPLAPELANALRSIMDRQPRQTSVVWQNFRVHFDTTGVDAPAMLDQNHQRIPNSAREFADSVLSILSFVADLETRILGYLPVPGDGLRGGGPEYDFYIAELGNMYGFTLADSATAEGGRSSSFVTIDNDFVFVRPDSNKGMPGLRVTIAHELHHAIQIGNYGYWSSDKAFYEMTSTWLEDVAYTNVNDYYNYLRSVNGHFQNPTRTFTSEEIIMYSRAIWCHFLAASFGPDIVRRSWEFIAGARPVSAIDMALETAGSNLPTAFADWTYWNFFTAGQAVPGKYYPEATWYPAIVQTAAEVGAGGWSRTGTLEVLAAKYYQVTTGLDSMTVVVVNTDMEASLAGTPLTSEYTLSLRYDQPDASYHKTPIGLYASLQVADPSKWVMWYIVGESIQGNFDPAGLTEGISFPSPFIPGEQPTVYIPVADQQPVQGQVFVYSAGMDLVYASPPTSSVSYLTKQMFQWDGRTDAGSYAPTGVYLYVIELPDRRVTGKVAVIRR